MNHPLKIISFLFLLIAFIFSIIWLIHKPEFETAITAISLLVATSSIFIDKWLSEREKRKELLVALINEIYINLNIITENPYKDEIQEKIVIYPRLNISTLETVIASGNFINRKDSMLFKQLNEWRDISNRFNSRLLVLEVHFFFNPTINYFNEINTGIVTSSALLHTRNKLVELAKLLTENYKKETKIDGSTIFFNTNNKK